MDPPGFALESFDVMGGWRDRYRGVAEDKPAEKGFGKNGQPFEFHFGLPVDSAGELPDGRPFQDIRDFKRLVREEDAVLARNLARQLLVYATGAPVRFGDRAEIERSSERERAALRPPHAHPRDRPEPALPEQIAKDGNGMALPRSVRVAAANYQHHVALFGYPFALDVWGAFLLRAGAGLFA